MLTVKLYNGDESTERTFYISDMTGYSNVQEALCMELIRIEENRKNEDKIALERLFDCTDFDDVDDLIEWICRMKDIESDLRDSGYDDIDGLTDRIQTLEDAINNIYYEADDVRR